MESARVVASSMGATMELQRSQGGDAASGDQPHWQRAFMDGSWQSVAAYERLELASGFDFLGPALVFERHCSTVVNSQWRGRVDDHGCLVLTRESSAKDVA